MNHSNEEYEPQVIPSPREQAHQWMVRLNDDNATALDRQRFQRWLAIDEDNRQAWRETEIIWQQATQIDACRLRSTQSGSSLWKKLAGWLKPRDAVDRGLWMPTALAGVLMFAVILWFNQSPAPTTSAVIYATTIGETKDVYLPEGSVITLGGDSSVVLHLSKDKRRVELRRGEAFFDVHPNKSRPFVVGAGDTRVTVLGTRFNVNRFNSHSRVSVAHGRVAVENQTSRERVELTPGQVVDSQTSGLAPIHTIQADQSGAWRNGLRLYIDAPLSDVVSDFNRHSPKPLHLSDPGLARLPVTAIFPADDQKKMLLSLQDVLPIELLHQDQQIIIQSRR